jgi:hypothetical protein
MHNFGKTLERYSPAKPQACHGQAKKDMKYIQVIVQEVDGCLIVNDRVFKLPVDKLEKVIEFIESLRKEGGVS